MPKYLYSDCLLPLFSLKKLNVSGSKGNKFKRSLSPLFKSLAGNSTLEELNISRNNIGDLSFLDLVESLYK